MHYYLGPNSTNMVPNSYFRYLCIVHFIQAIWAIFVLFGTIYVLFETLFVLLKNQICDSSYLEPYLCYLITVCAIWNVFLSIIHLIQAIRNHIHALFSLFQLFGTIFVLLRTVFMDYFLDSSYLELYLITEFSFK